MTLDEFWEHIKKTKRKDPEAHVEKLTARLSQLHSDEVVDFDHWWNLLAREAYHWNLWAAAYLMNGGCSDDGFTDFRSWLILKGRDVFQTAVSNPDTLADIADPDEDEATCECYPAAPARGSPRPAGRKTTPGTPRGARVRREVSGAPAAARTRRRLGLRRRRRDARAAALAELYLDGE